MIMHVYTVYIYIYVPEYIKTMSRPKELLRTPNMEPVKCSNW